MGGLNSRSAGWATHQVALTDAHIQHHIQSARHQTTRTHEHPTRATQPQHSRPKNASLK
jgi:hypothetical protein